MSRLGVFAFLLASLSLGACSSEPSYRLAGGEAIRFSELRGDWVVLNYWAEWCAPCRKEIPELNELQEHSVEPGAAVRVFGINYDGLQGADLDARERVDRGATEACTRLIRAGRAEEQRTPCRVLRWPALGVV